MGKTNMKFKDIKPKKPAKPTAKPISKQTAKPKKQYSNKKVETKEVQIKTKEKGNARKPASQVTKLIFDDDGNPIKVVKNKSTGFNGRGSNMDYFERREKEQKKRRKVQEDVDDDDDEASKRWYQLYPEYQTDDPDDYELKDKDYNQLYKSCNTAYKQLLPTFTKKNAPDAHLLNAMIRKGTGRDRARAGAMLISTNPLGNLEAITALVGFTKVTEKDSPYAIQTMEQLWREALLPPDRVLRSIQMRGHDWQQLRKDGLSNDKRKRVLAYWFFEDQLKSEYLDFVKNVQQNLQIGKENNKIFGIVAATKLLSYGPEKEGLLLNMLVNKLGDPSATVAGRALYELKTLAFDHPKMSCIILDEIEKLLFRNNVSERAQHYALCCLAEMAICMDSIVCSHLVNVCLTVFKILVGKGIVNSRMMRAILRCMRKAIRQISTAGNCPQILTTDVEDTIYRMIHFAEIGISVQAFALLLETIQFRPAKNDRFYNALYEKMMCLDITTMGTKPTSVFLYILHRAMHIDKCDERVLAFLKRIFQICLCVPPNVSAGYLIVVHKLTSTRKDLMKKFHVPIIATAELIAFDSDDDDDNSTQSEIATNDEVASNGNAHSIGNDNGNKAKDKRIYPQSWVFRDLMKLIKDDKNFVVMSPQSYNPYHRVPLYCGAELTVLYELSHVCQHYHPAVRRFAEIINTEGRIDYYGDPLRDFSLPHFLERFSFKNPKKNDPKDQSMASTKPDAIYNKKYTPFGSRATSVHSLTDKSCVEEDRFILRYMNEKNELSQKIDQQKKKRKRSSSDDDEANDGDGGNNDHNNVQRSVDVNDDEFDEYLDGYYGKKVSPDDGFDFNLGALDEPPQKPMKRKATSLDNDEDSESYDDFGNESSDTDADLPDWEVTRVDNAVEANKDQIYHVIQSALNHSACDSQESGNDTPTNMNQTDSDGSDESSFDENSSTEKMNTTKAFTKKFKNSNDMSSLFVAVDDLSEMFEATGKEKGQGTSRAVFNKDKSCKKQLNWEEKRQSNQLKSKALKKRQLSTKKSGMKSKKLKKVRKVKKSI